MDLTTFDRPKLKIYVIFRPYVGQVTSPYAIFRP